MMLLSNIALVLSAAALTKTAPLEKRDEQWTSPPVYPSPQGGWVPNWKISYEKAQALVAKMTLAEKVNITTGTGWSMGRCVGNTAPAERVGFPALCMEDGPLGVRFADLITAFPAGITTGATFNEQLMLARGQAMGQEFRGKGVNMALSPCVGPLGKFPLGGRNWEGFGSDPYLQGLGGYNTVKGIQQQGVIATIKHFIGNEQEHFRQTSYVFEGISSNIDDRTLHEFYLWPFAEAVRAGVGSVMCSYNQINNSYGCQNSKLLNGILKDELGFQGFVVSDWLAQRSGVASALAGLDNSMPGDGYIWADGSSFWGPQLSTAVLNSSVPVDRLNDAVTRTVATWYQLGQDQGFPELSFSAWTKADTDNEFHGAVSGPQITVNTHVPVQGNHAFVARQITTESIVLLKNTGNTLPLKKSQHVAIFGTDAGNNTQGINGCSDRGCDNGVLGQGWGSGSVDYPYLTTPIDAIKTVARNVTAIITDNASNDVISLASTPGIASIVFLSADSGEGYITVEGNAGDRNDISTWHNGDALVQAVANVCNNTIVVIHSVGPIVMEKWIDLPNVKAVLMAHLPGQEAGSAVVDILYGRSNPSGKLPYTIGKSLQDYGPTAGIIYNAITAPQQTFTEGAYFDYRYFDKYNVTPRYEFGYGLSYTTFSINNINIATIEIPTEEPRPRPVKPVIPFLSSTIPPASEVSWPTSIANRVWRYVYPYIDNATAIQVGIYPYPDGYTTTPQPPAVAGGGEGGNPALFDTIYQVTVSITNTGRVAGKIAAQLYLGFPQSSFDTPIRQLRGIQKVWLAPGQSAKVTFQLTRKDLSVWDVARQNWIIPGKGHTVYVGRSSRDLPVSVVTPY